MKIPLPQECEDRHYWSRKFSFASWLFLILGLWAVFASSTPWSALIGIGVSLAFKTLNNYCDKRHREWHDKRREGEKQ